MHLENLVHILLILITTHLQKQTPCIILISCG